MPFPPRPVIDTLSSPEFHGRGYVKNGDLLAGNWLVGRFKRAGLSYESITVYPLGIEIVGDTTKSFRSYSQYFVHDVNVFPKEPALEISGKKVVLGRWIPDAASGKVKGRFKAWVPDSIEFFARVATHDWKSTEVPCIPEHWLKGQKEVQESLVQYPPKALIFINVKKLTSTIAEYQLPYARLYLDSSVQIRNGDLMKLKIQPKFQVRNSYNVLARVPGTARPDSVIVVGAHYDHLGGLGPKVYFPGANDNASGTAMLLELATYYAKNPGRYTMLFCSFAAEEAGLAGSGVFVRNPSVPLDKVRFMLNLDLLGSGETGGTLVNAPAVQPDFDLLKSLNDTLKALPRLKPRRNAPNSDHYTFARAGVPAMFLYLEGPYAHYHDVDDRPERLTLAGFEGTFRLLSRFLGRLQGQ